MVWIYHLKNKAEFIKEKNSELERSIWFKNDSHSRDDFTCSVSSVVINCDLMLWQAAVSKCFRHGSLRGILVVNFPW